MNIVVLGAPGVGKGTYTTALCEEIGLPHISTGDMFRENIKQKTELGQTAEGFISRGRLVPDELTTQMLAKRLQEPDCKKGFVLDGFPRTLNQAKLLEGIAKIDLVLSFVADEEVVLQRLSGRRVCRKCGATFHIVNIPTQKEGICDVCGGEIYQRNDDKEETIKERLKVYARDTKPLIEHYSSILKEVDVNSPISEKSKIIGGIRELLSKL